MINVLSCLIKTNRYRVFVISTEDENYIRHSRIVANYFFYPETEDDSAWIRVINQEVLKHNIDVILPILQIPIRRLIKNRSLLENPEKLVVLPELKDYDVASDKWQLFKHLSRNNLPSPETLLYDISDGEQLKDFPRVVKPSIGFGGGQNIELLADQNDLEAYFRYRSLEQTDYILQEYIEGWDYSCSVLCLDGEVLAHTIQKSGNPENSTYGPQMNYRFESNDEILMIVGELMKSLNWSGVASVDVRYDQVSQQYKILEINPRFWRSLIGSLYAGINFPHLLVELSLKGYIEEKPSYKNIQFYDLKGYFNALRSKPAFAFNFGVMKRNTPLGMIFYDPWPYYHKFIWRSNNILKRYLKPKKR